MKNRLKCCFLFAAILGLCLYSAAQFTPEEIAEIDQWEEFLTSAKITAQEKPWGLKEAVTEPWLLTLEKDGVTRKAIWKNPEFRLKGHLEGWKWEIAAFRLDKYLGVNMVPPTVEKRFQGDRGSCQLVIEFWIDLRKKNKDKIKVNPRRIFYYNRATFLQRAFHNLIANADCHPGNVLLTKDWRMILVDHSRSFRTTKKFTKKLIYTEKHKDGPRVMKELPRVFIEKLKSLNFKVVRDIVGEYLTDKEIEAVLIRKDLILKEIDKRIKKLGEEKVLY